MTTPVGEGPITIITTETFVVLIFLGLWILSICVARQFDLIQKKLKNIEDVIRKSQNPVPQPNARAHYGPYTEQGVTKHERS